MGININKIISNIVSSFIQEYHYEHMKVVFRKSCTLQHKFLDTNINEGQNLIE